MQSNLPEDTSSGASSLGLVLLIVGNFIINITMNQVVTIMTLIGAMLYAFNQGWVMRNNIRNKRKNK